MSKFFSLVCFILFIQSGFSQEILTFKIKKYQQSVLSDSLQETSGLSFFNHRLFTFNDSGNKGELFEIDKNSGKIIKVFDTKLINQDWEALANDGENFYIGDFGNNLGTRRDLKIYKIPFKENHLELDSTKIISFYYPEQTNFSPKNLNNNFDAEAMIWYNESLHIFTKEWETNTVSHYLVDAHNFELQPAKKIETYNTEFVVTDASYHDKKLYLVGYTKSMGVYLLVFEVADKSELFFGKPLAKYFLGSTLSIGQIEGISVSEQGIYISGERFDAKIMKIPQSFYFIPFREIEN